MSRRPATFTQSDVSRALKGAESAGFEVGEVQIERDGTIRLLPKATDTAQADERTPEAW